MAKKKKATKKGKKIKSVRVKPKAKILKTVTKTKKSTVMQSVYTLSFTGSIIILLAGIIFLLTSITKPFVALFTTSNVLLALPNIICGLVMLIATAQIRKNPKASAIIIMFFSVLALIFEPYGFIVGPILGLLGSIILLARK